MKAAEKTKKTQLPRGQLTHEDVEKKCPVIDDTSI